ncbi:YhgE/Pip domain-containing protein [Macrococcus armenti]|uniref:YhgE/Pip domain-containing protein n=1 Tax=Macrococcus armenti TaxID=2875764 RepID=UPI001CCBE4F4|nr:YhgE/Pip domain-containing protein [Macrococcus armenti]UBH15486.1 YhgE/Pip domain-containing protein [Macrococcus armenti]UBH17846.1 YhgE/Pip domain-containing protein [Macrococcus armenti]UBH20111.1 YhgE/Pip domain-containing protein [Macrococcus armenti]
MKNAFQLFLHDLKNIKRTPSFIILLLGLAILPSFYAWFNLKSSWDPYSNTEYLKVAIVNHDKGAEVQGKKVNVGNQLVNNLKDNKKFGWVFTDDLKEANKQLEYGNYYAIIHIPKNFSEDVTSILHKKPKRAHIDYKVNQKINAIAPKMTNAGATAITQSLNEKFVDSATKALLDESNRVGLKLQDKLPLYHKIENAVYEAEKAIPQMEEFKQTVNKIDRHQGDISKYADEFYSLSNYEGKINEGADKLIKANEHAGDINAAGQMIVNINNNMPVIEDALQKANTIEQKFPQINDAVAKGIQATSTAQSAISSAQIAMPDVHKKINNAQSITNNAQTDVKSAETSLEQPTAENPISEKATTEKTVVDKETEPLKKPDLLPAKDALNNGLMAISQLTKEEAAATQDTLNQLQALSEQNPGSSEVLAKNIEIYQHNLEQSIAYYNEVIKLMDQAQKLGLGDTSKITRQLNDSIGTLTTLNQSLNTTLNGAKGNGNVSFDNAAIQNAIKSLSSLEAFAGSDMQKILSNGLSLIDSNLDTIAGKLSDASQFANDVDRILADATQITSNAHQTLLTINAELPALEEKFSRINQTAQANLPTFKSKVGEASSFVESELPSVLNDLNRLGAFASNDLPGVMKKYNEASHLLQNKLPGAQEKIHELAMFSNEELPGIEKEIKQAADKFRELDKNDTLNKLIKLLRNDLEDQSDYFAEPIQLDETQVFPIPNYGSASAPFYTALALWVGALLSGNLLTTELKDKSLIGKFSLRELYLGRMILFLLLSIAQATIVVLGNLFILDAYAKHPVYNVLFAILVGIAFTIMVYTVVSLLGNIGKAIAIIIMVLQIAGGGGTFPIQVTPKFFQAIHPFLPFTYAVDLLREAVGGIVPEIAWSKLGMLYLIAALTFAFGLALKPKFEPIKKGFYARSKASNLVE